MSNAIGGHSASGSARSLLLRWLIAIVAYPIGGFGGMSLTHASDGTTVLVGPVVDQAALHGLLQKLRDLGVTLMSVNEDEIDPLVRDDPRSEPLNQTTRRSR